MPLLQLRLPAALGVRSCLLVLAALTGCADAHESNADGAAGAVAEVGDASASQPDASPRSPASWDAALSPLAALDCVELQLAAERRISDWLAVADKACSTDADCVVLVPRPSCVWSCTDAYVSMRGEASPGAVIDELEHGICVAVSRRCTVREPVRCDQTQLEPRCAQGVCRARRKGCPDDPRALEGLPCTEPGKTCIGFGAFAYEFACTGPISGEYYWRENIYL
jgi:hypothetical protein